MKIQLFNTPTNKKEDFAPLHDNDIKLYTCGPTVYGDPHVGNWMAYIRWDLLVRLLKESGYTVNRIMNITDVGHLVSDADEGEDKLQLRAEAEGLTAWDISERYTALFFEGMNSLNLIPATTYAKATDFIPEQIELIKQLEEKGHTYRITDGVYFDTATFPDYATFAHLDLEGMKAGARIEQNNEKRNPSDFALWKFSPTNKQRDMEWDSPWGKGFPGWHLECSAIAMKLLGETLDIHTGGIDHIPVHHTNEIAQSESVTGKPFSRFWLHANFLLVGGTKISKSLKNGYTLHDLKEKGFTANDFRMFSLQSHYRTESNFTWELLAAAHNRLKRWHEVAELRWQMHDTVTDDEDKAISDISLKVRGAHKTILAHLADDLNTPEMLRSIEEILDVITFGYEHLQQDVLMEFLELIERITGLQLLEPTPDIGDEAKRLLMMRQRARENKEYDASDKLRAELEKHEIIVRDNHLGQSWSRQR